ncbi:uracil-DNA glycosylase family protein [Halobacillus amylolyticus]|uniref:Uracil-DNA glycosylase-like domain-containing protein n=1 Tax=Halobacillus amylolyticus TaxID=2932259 RepID=A0ABY4HGE7_9BACI|nr:uracil-DNA glycosylase family protein [Halobacillus amylolyticus]UOR13621.1 hypothetical protein MUO15_09325 [Halobacillus amylolyticus]
MVWGEGDLLEAPIIIILDNPEAREDREGNPFVCGTRQALQQAANEAGLTMNDLYVTFNLKGKPFANMIKRPLVESVWYTFTDSFKPNNPLSCFV